MENTLIESRLNKILKDRKFNSKNKNLDNFLNKETGIFISDYFLTLEFEEIDGKTIDKQQKNQIKDISKLDHVDKDDDSIQYVAVYLWVFNLGAGSFMEADDNKLAIRIPVDLQTHNIFKSYDVQTQSASSGDNLANVFCISKKSGEKSLQIINSNIDEYQIAIYSEKQIYVGHIQSLLESLRQQNKQSATNQQQSSKVSFTMYRVQLLIQKYSPSILSIKFHKLSSHHLAVLLDDQYFIVYNLQSSLSYHEVQYNLTQIPRFGRDNNINVTEQDHEKFIDFEFGGNNDLSVYSNKPNKQNVISDFDFLSVYFLTEDGHLYYQSPFIIKGMRIDRDLLEQLKQYLNTELSQVKQLENVKEKIQLLQIYQELVENIDNNDLIKESDHSTLLTKSFSVSQIRASHASNLNSISLQQLENDKIKIQLAYIPTEKNEDERDENISNQASKFGTSNISNKSGKNVFTKSLLDRVLNINKPTHTINRKYIKLHKIETNGSFHAFILIKQIGDKNYSSVQSRFSPLPIMPTNVIQNFYTFALIQGEKARLDCPLIATINQNGKNDRKQLYEFKKNSYARLCQKSINISQLDSVCFQVMNRVYCINFKWLQNLISTDLSDDSVFNNESLTDSEVRVLVDSKNVSSTSNIDNLKISDFSFYTLISQDRMLLALLPQETFRLKCFTMQYLSNYIQIQESAKIINNTLSKFIETSAFLDLTAPVAPSKPLSQNKVNLNEGDPKKETDLKQFEQLLSNYINEHEKVVKENVELIKDKYNEVLKRKQELDKKKAEVEKEMYDVTVLQKNQIQQKSERIMQKNTQINKKIQEIAQLLKNPKIVEQIGEQNPLESSLNSNYSQQTKEYYDKLKRIQEQYQNYFTKRAEFFGSIGGYEESDQILNKEIAEEAVVVSKKVKQHIQILDNQLERKNKQND